MTPRRPSVLNIEDPVQNAPAHIEEDSQETRTALREKQIRMEQHVHRIWTYVFLSFFQISKSQILLISVLSAFEESSAACISDVLRQCTNGDYLGAIRMAEKFILHVEVLFGTIVDLESHFASLNMKG